MPDDQTAALQALIQQVTTLTEKVEAQDAKYADTYKLNAKLLAAQKGDGKTPDLPDHIQAILDGNDTAKVDWAKVKQAVDAKLAPPDPTAYRKGDPIQISRSDALDTRKYAAAQAKAKELGVPLEMVDDRPSAQHERPATYQSRETDTSLIDTLDDTVQKLRYVRHDVATGGAGIIQNGFAAERDGYRMVTFKDETDLPDHMQTKLSLMASAQQAGSNDQAD